MAQKAEPHSLCDVLTTPLSHSHKWDAYDNLHAKDGGTLEQERGTEHLEPLL